jgi:MFS family permease
MVIASSYNIPFTDGAKYAFTVFDTLFLAEPTPVKTSFIGYIQPSGNYAVANDTSLIKFKSKDDNALIEGTTYLNVVKKASNTKPQLERTLGKAMFWKFVFLVFIQIIFVTMVYGPMAAFLVELFPTKIRYTSMSLPYHIGNGVFGGLVPFLGTLIVELTKTSSNPIGDPLAGLWYPIGVAALCLIIGIIYLPGKIDNKVMD